MEDIRRDDCSTEGKEVCFDNFQNPYSQNCFIPFAGFSPERSEVKGLTDQAPRVWLADCSRSVIRTFGDLMPQEISVSYQAIKSKVYRLIDALVVGEKNEAEVQESIRRWWELIHPADRPIAQKYLVMILERSSVALDCVEEGLVEGSQNNALRSSLRQTLRSAEPPKVLKMVGRVVKDASLSSPSI
jgi:hypothetical protein